MTITAKRSALATAVSTVDIPGLKVTDKVPEQVNPPQAVVYRNTVSYDQYEGAEFGDLLNFGVIVYVGRIAENKAQEIIDALVEPTGTTSLKVAVESNAALLALCGWVLVRTAGPAMRTTVGQIDYLTVEFSVEIGD